MAALTGREGRPTLGAGAIAAIGALALLVAALFGLLIGRASAGDRATAAPTSVVTSQPPASGREPRNADYASRAGARFVRSLAAVPQASSRNEAAALASGVAAEGSSAHADLMRSYDEFEAAKAQYPGLTFSQAPLYSKVDMAGDSAATVVFYTVTHRYSTGFAINQQTWGTVSITLRWANDKWAVVSAIKGAGPTPEQTNPADNTAQSAPLLAGLKRFDG